MTELYALATSTIFNKVLPLLMSPGEKNMLPGLLSTLRLPHDLSSPLLVFTIPFQLKYVPSLLPHF